MLAKAEIIGNVGRDIEGRQIGAHFKASFSLASESGFGNKKKTMWWNIEAWGKQAETLVSYGKKGAQIWITGNLEQWQKEEPDGSQSRGLTIKMTDFKIIKFPPRDNNQNQAPYQNQSQGLSYDQNQGYNQNHSYQEDQSSGFPPDDLPF